MWPTPTAGEGTGYLSGSTRKTWRPTLASAARGLWPTPMGTEGQKGGPGRRSGQGYAYLSAAVHWPTPVGRDGKGPRSPRKQQENPGPTLPEAVLWPTPTRADGPSGPGHTSAQGTPNLRTQARRNEVDQVPSALNPSWVECLMGFPQGWTATAGPPLRATRPTRGSRPARSCPAPCPAGPPG